MEQFYVYGYFDALSGVPFYIGKGKGKRCQQHLKEAANPNSRDPNKHKIGKIRQHIKNGNLPVIKVIDDNLTEDVAFELECFLISWIGRSDLGNGPLTNLSNGGEGLTGIVRNLSGENNPNYGKRGESSVWWGKLHTEETKEKIRVAQAGKTLTDAHKAAIRKPKSESGKAAIALARKTSLYKPSEETKLKISISLKGRTSPMLGRKQSDETKAKISAHGKNKPKPKYECVNCKGLFAANMINRWHNQNCKVKK